MEHFGPVRGVLCLPLSLITKSWHILSYTGLIYELGIYASVKGRIKLEHDMNTGIILVGS